MPVRWRPGSRSDRWRTRSTSPSSPSTGPSARTGRSRASSSWPASRTSAPACSPAPSPWTRSCSRTSCAATTCRWSSTPGFAAQRVEREPEHVVREVAESIGAHSVVKPARLGSSVGMSLVHDLDELPAALDEAFRYDSKVIVERYVEHARELECGVLGNEDPIVFEPGEVRSSHEFYDYEAKYVDGAGVGRAARRRRPRPGGPPQGAVAGRLPRGRRGRPGADRLPRHPGRGLHQRDEHAARLHRHQHVPQAGRDGRHAVRRPHRAAHRAGHGARPMKLKPQPKVARRRGAADPSARSPGRGVADAAPGARPGAPFRRRMAGGCRRSVASSRASARWPPPPVLVALLGGPWLRVTEVAWAGEQFTADARPRATAVERQRGVSLLAVDTRRAARRVGAAAGRRRGIGLREPAGARGGRDRRARGGLRVGDGAQPGCSARPTARCSRRFAATMSCRRPWRACRSSTTARDGARLIAVGDRIPEALLRTALRLAGLDPVALGSGSARAGRAPRRRVRLRPGRRANRLGDGARRLRHGSGGDRRRTRRRGSSAR